MIDTQHVQIERREYICECIGLNYRLSATKSELFVEPTLFPRNGLTIPLSEVLSVHLKAGSVVPPLSIALASLIALLGIWGYAGNWSWPIRLSEGYQAIWSWASLIFVGGLADGAFRSIFASLRIDAKNLTPITIRITGKNSASRFVERLSSIMQL